MSVSSDKVGMGQEKAQQWRGRTLTWPRFISLRIQLIDSCNLKLHDEIALIYSMMPRPL